MWLASTCFWLCLDASESHEFQDGTGKWPLLRSDRARLEVVNTLFLFIKY